MPARTKSGKHVSESGVESKNRRSAKHMGFAYVLQQLIFCQNGFGAKKCISAFERRGAFRNACKNRSRNFEGEASFLFSLLKTAKTRICVVDIRNNALKVCSVNVWYRLCLRRCVFSMSKLCALGVV